MAPGALRGLGDHQRALVIFALVEFVIPFSAIALGERWISSSVSGRLIATALAMPLMFYPVTHAGASRASLITYINPAVATLLGVWLPREYLGFGAMAALVLILAGFWVARRAAPGRVKRRTQRDVT